jgi:hypothetical protein
MSEVEASPVTVAEVLLNCEGEKGDELPESEAPACDEVDKSTAATKCSMDSYFQEYKRPNMSSHEMAVRKVLASLGKSAIVAPLPAGLTASPYMDEPSRCSGVQTRRTERKIASPREKQDRWSLITAFPNHSPRHYKAMPSVDYRKNQQQMRKLDQEPRDKTERRNRDFRRNTPYREQLYEVRKKSIEKSRQMAKQREKSWMEERKRENKEVKEAKFRSYLRDVARDGSGLSPLITVRNAGIGGTRTKYESREFFMREFNRV